MKGYTIWLSLERHREIKLASAKTGRSMRELLLSGNYAEGRSIEVPLAEVVPVVKGNSDLKEPYNVTIVEAPEKVKGGAFEGFLTGPLPKDLKESPLDKSKSIVLFGKGKAYEKVITVEEGAVPILVAAKEVKQPARVAGEAEKGVSVEDGGHESHEPNAETLSAMKELEGGGGEVIDNIEEFLSDTKRKKPGSLGKDQGTSFFEGG